MEKDELVFWGTFYMILNTGPISNLNENWDQDNSFFFNWGILYLIHFFDGKSNSSPHFWGEDRRGRGGLEVCYNAGSLLLVGHWDRFFSLPACCTHVISRRTWTLGVHCRAADVSFLVRLADHVDRIDTVVEILATPWPVTLSRHRSMPELWLSFRPWMTGSHRVCGLGLIKLL